jgi:hypothetical protein
LFGVKAFLKNTFDILNALSMKLKIGKGDTIKNIQELFNNTYPFLRIEFVRKKAVQKEKLDGNECIVLPFNEPAVDIDINSDQTVKSLEAEFKIKANMEVKVYRRFSNVWIETSLTDDWTLEQQNTEGRLLSELNRLVS